MNNYELIKLIKNHEDFQYIFMYEGGIDMNELFIPNDIIKKLHFIDWIYLSELPAYQLIGVDKKNSKIYALNEDCEDLYLCNHLYEIPFIFLDINIKGNNKKFKLHNEKIYQPYLNKLNFYINWCEDNNIEIDSKYLEILKP